MTSYLPMQSLENATEALEIDVSEQENQLIILQYIYTHAKLTVIFLGFHVSFGVWICVTAPNKSVCKQGTKSCTLKMLDDFPVKHQMLGNWIIKNLF